MDTMTTPAPQAVLVTGGTSGIGAACAQALRSAGAKVWVTGTRPETVEQAVNAGVADGGSVADVRDRTTLKHTFDAAIAEFGQLTGVFANAGIDGEAVPASTISESHFRDVLDVNVVGTFNTAQLAYEYVTRPGQLVINTSINAIRMESQFADYNASKAAALALAQSFALEWAASGLSVIAVAPGYFPSRMTAPYLDDPDTHAELVAATPIGRVGTPEEIGRLVTFLLDPQSAYLNGATITIDGGRHL